MPSRSRFSEVKAEMATGTSCRLWLALFGGDHQFLDGVAGGGGAGPRRRAVWAWADDVPKAVANSSALDAKKRTLLCNLTSPVGQAGQV